MLLNDKISLFRRYYQELFYHKKDVFDIFLRVKCGGRRKTSKIFAIATRTQRIVNGIPASYDDPIIIVGVLEAYEPRCRHCHEVRGKLKF